MGKHFDTLVEVMRGKMHVPGTNGEFRPQRDWSRLVKSAALFDMPLLAEEIRNTLDMEKADYIRYMDDYYDLSKEYNTQILLPFDNTAIEDSDSVVFGASGEDKVEVGVFEVLPAPKTWMMLYGNVDFPGRNGEVSTGVPGHYTVEYVVRSTRGVVTYLDCAELAQDINDSLTKGDTFNAVRTTQCLEEMVKVFSSAAVSFSEQAAYIMDPSNFIVEKESNQSVKQRGKKNKKAIPFKKTVMRPHYTCLSEEDLRDFVKSESKAPRAAHPVRGHWRRLMSEKFVNKRGQRTLVKQYFTGDGKFDGRNGWNYHVWIQDGPNSIVPYSTE